MNDKTNALAEMAQDLEILKIILENEHHPKGLQVADKAQRIVAELAKVKLVNGTYGAVAVLSETETDGLFRRILAIAEEGAGDGK